MSESVFDCEELESLLSAYLDGELDAARRRAVERHVASCSRCAALLRDVEAIVRDARGLPTLSPSRDLWPGIEARIQPDVVPLSARAAEREAATPRTPLRWTRARLVAAAAALVICTAGITYVATTYADSARSSVASSDSARDGSSDYRAVGSSTVPSGRVRNASAMSSEQLYDQEIAHLQAILREHRSLLDSATIAVIQRNLAIVDSAIAQSRAALAADPNSRFLNEQLNSVLDQKVELLRTAALLPART